MASVGRMTGVWKQIGLIRCDIHHSPLHRSDHHERALETSKSWESSGSRGCWARIGFLAEQDKGQSELCHADPLIWRACAWSGSGKRQWRKC